MIDSRNQILQRNRSARNNQISCLKVNRSINSERTLSTDRKDTGRFSRPAGRITPPTTSTYDYGICASVGVLSDIIINVANCTKNPPTIAVRKSLIS